MDRRHWILAACGLMLSLLGTGCKSTRSEVPPKSPYTSDGRGLPSVGFSSQPHPPTANGGSYLPSGGAMPGGAMPGGPMPGGPGQFGTPGATSSTLGLPPGNSYGPPGTSGVPGGPGAYTDPLMSKAAMAPGLSNAAPTPR